MTCWRLSIAYAGPWGEAGPSKVASLRYDDDPALLSAIDLLHSLLTCPESLGWLLLALPAETLDQVGTLVAERLKDLPG
jgi:hypothetical protein